MFVHPVVVLHGDAFEVVGSGGGDGQDNVVFFCEGLKDVDDLVEVDEVGIEAGPPEDDGGIRVFVVFFLGVEVGVDAGGDDGDVWVVRGDTFFEVFIADDAVFRHVAHFPDPVVVDKPYERTVDTGGVFPDGVVNVVNHIGV